ncbi:CMD domain protein [Zwartia sp.]|uniref:CMD domain-containing protein n=1 Tax=Zwartia sp. TaxID=2978004 RepID=UPI00271763B7|nr:CMD domain protein [Zwartia sp.]MDO9026035.1 CMD domain protein [Zwartia sp.]
MTVTSSPSNHSDTLDRILGLAPGSLAFETRHQRAKVVDATQASETLLLDSPIEGLPLSDRLLVALLACALTPSPELVAEYAQRLKGTGVTDAVIDEVSGGTFSLIRDERLKQILTFTHTLITDPIKADKQALLTLKSSGLSTAHITALAQLIAFVSYQVRVSAGLKALKAFGEQA